MGAVCAGVADHEGLVLVAVLVEDPVEAVVERPALAAPREVVSVPDDGAGLLGLLVRVVCAGVADHEDVHELARVVLREDGAHEVADDELLIVRRDEERVAVLLLGLGQRHRPAEHDADHVDDLIEVREREEEPDDQVEDDDRREAEPVELHRAHNPSGPTP